jgi:flagellar protein FlaH
LFPSKGTISYEGMIDRVLSSDKLMGSDLIIFDTLSEITLKNKVDEKDHIELLGKLKKVIGMGDGRSIVLCVDPSTMDEKLMGMLRRLSEVYLVLEEREIYGSKLYYMVIKRYLGARNSVEKEIPYKVRAGIGIVIELAS